MAWFVVRGGGGGVGGCERGFRRPGSEGRMRLWRLGEAEVVVE